MYYYFVNLDVAKQLDTNAVIFSIAVKLSVYNVVFALALSHQISPSLGSIYGCAIRYYRN